MILYLDTSALIKLYIIEPGSDSVNTIITNQATPLPIWDLHQIEFQNALSLKVFREELRADQAETLISNFKQRKKDQIYYTPELDRKEHTDYCLELTAHSRQIGCRSLDIMHVAAAKIYSVDQFITFDSRQADLAEKAGMSVFIPDRN